MDFRPQTWIPPKSPGLQGVYAPNDRLAAAELWGVDGKGPEDVVVGPDDWAVTGLEDGRMMRLSPDGMSAETFAETGGRPLGVELYGADFLVCDADRGLLVVTPAGEVVTLCDADGDVRFAITNNAAVGADETVYFSVSSLRWSLATYKLDLLEQSATGRLYRRNPDGTLDLLADGLCFANGVALAPDESFVLVAETGRYRIQRVWLTGERAGTVDVWLENLPGFPDNLTCDGEIIWCAFPRPRDPVLDATYPRPWARKLIARLPDSLQPKPSRHGFVVGYDLEGRVVHNLQDTTGRVAVTTSARRHGDRLYVGSLSAPHVAVLTL